jgi:succinate dehydrogenase (ubiquinone) cytochrome b560 subunit
VSPDVFEINSATEFHYKMPINAISSVTNRFTGVALSGCKFSFFADQGATSLVAFGVKSSAVASECCPFCSLAVIYGGALLSLTGDLPAAVDWIQHSFLVYPAKAAVVFPLFYHYGGGLRHLVWDKWQYGKQTDKSDPLENSKVDQSSFALFYASAAATAAAAVYSF